MSAADIAQQLNPEVPHSPILKQLFRLWASINGSDEACGQVGIRYPPLRAVRIDRISRPRMDRILLHDRNVDRED